MKYLVAFILLLFVWQADAKTMKEGVSLYTKEEIYSQGLDLFKENKIKKAAEKFQKLSNLYPFSDIGTKALLVSAFLYYLNEDYLDAALSSENYIKFYWQTPEVEYMYYLRAISLFMKIKNGLTNAEYSIKAKKYFMDLLTDFPNSKYVKSSLEKLAEIDKILAAYEINIGKFYMKKGDYAAAIPRFQSALKYQGAESFEEAHYRMFEVYCILQIKSEASAHFNILGNSSVQSKWFNHAVKLIKTCN